jgi:hypothetical protein
MKFRYWPGTNGVSVPEATTPVRKLDSLAIQMMRTCGLCGGEFERAPGPGRPRLYCYGCEPPGWQLVKVRGRLKLRRRRRDLLLRVVA